MITCYSEGHQGSDLPLEAVGGDAGVVAGVAAGDFGEVELAVPLLHAGRYLSSVCRGRQTDTQGQGGVRRAEYGAACEIQMVKLIPSWQRQMKGEMNHDDESSLHSVYCRFCACFLHILVETAFAIISIKGMKCTAAFWMTYFLKC